MSWVAPEDNGSDITHYLVRYARNVTGNEPFSSDRRVNAPLTRVNLTGLAVGIEHVIQIQAVNGIGTGPNADADFTGSTGLYPNAPASVTAVPKVDGDGIDADRDMVEGHPDQRHRPGRRLHRGSP